jgi:hypothetical protein
VRRLRALSEAECYTRCYGGWEQTVRLLRPDELWPAGRTILTGEQIRELFEGRLDARGPEAAEAA